MKRGFLHSFFNQTQDFFVWAHKTSRIFIFERRNQKKSFPRGFLRGRGQNTPFFLYSNPSPGLMFQWIVRKISTTTNYDTYFMTNDQYSTFINQVLTFWFCGFKSFSYHLFLSIFFFIKKNGIAYLKKIWLDSLIFQWYRV